MLILIFNSSIRAQITKTYNKEGLKVYLSEDSSRYVKATGLAQIWFRYNQNNPGSNLFGTTKPETEDVGLRRVRYQTLAQINKHVFFYSQFGINNVNSVSARKSQLFFHDVTAEYNVYKNYCVLGGGLSGWNGTSRFSSSAVGSILCMDLPTILETTNDVTDQFVRKMGVYAKGKIGNLDYRFSAANPYPVQTASTNAIGAGNVATLPAVSTATSSVNSQAAFNTAYFSTRAPAVNYQGYLMWQFLEKESNLTPYMTGSYLGKKKIFNIGAGFEFQKNAMMYRRNISDTALKFTAIKQFGLDVFYDCYLNKEKQNAITFYLAYLIYDFGPNYLRTSGPMNTTNGITANNINGTGAFSGTGNSFPLIGTGNVIYTQAAYLFKKDLLKKQGTLQPYASAIYGNYERLKDPLLVYNVGVNWIMAGQNSKLSFDYQSRPIYQQDIATGDVNEIKSARRGQFVLQYQVAF